MLSYQQLYHKTKDEDTVEWMRHQLVKCALASNIKKAAKTNNCHVKTVRKWFNRYKNDEPLSDRSKAPNHTPHRLDESSTKNC